MRSTMVKMANAPIEPPITGPMSKMEKLQMEKTIKKFNLQYRKVRIYWLKIFKICTLPGSPSRVSFQS